MKKKILIGIAILLLAALALIPILFFSTNKNLPSSQQGDRAEQLAQKMNTAINKAAWDTTRYVQWTFKGEHNYLWDRELKAVEVSWDYNRVLLDIDNVTGRAYAADSEITDKEERTRLINDGHSFFINDAFWLNAPSMIYNPGVTRGFVDMEGNYDGLMITYHSGGVTPGDSYLWKLDKQGRPVSYQMWVSIIPVGGLEFTWENWTQLSSGAQIAQNHKSSLLEIPITGLKDGQHYTDLGRASDPFIDLVIKKK